MAMLATRERSAARELVWPPPDEELDALEVIDLRGPATSRAEAPSASVAQLLRAVVPRAEPAPAPLVRTPASVETLQHATPTPAASQPVPTGATWRMRVPRLAAISAMLLFATMVGVLLGVRDARRSMTAGYTRLRESVVAVREYVEHVGTPPAATARATAARPASTLTPTRSRIVAAAPSTAASIEASTAVASTRIATPEIAASPNVTAFDAASLALAAAPRVAAPLISAQPLAAEPLAAAPVATESLAPPTAMPNAVSPVATAIVSTVSIEGRVKQALLRYQQAYDTLDARAAAASWPSVDVAALTRAFNNLKSQSLTFDRCTVDVVSTSAATASCTGSTTAVRQVGSTTPFTRSLQWTFNLRRGADDDAWVIDSVTTTRP